MEIVFVRRCQKSKQNSAKIIHRNTALKLTFSILLCNNSDRKCFFRALTFAGFFGLRPRFSTPQSEASECALGFQHLPRDPANVNARKKHVWALTYIIGATRSWCVLEDCFKGNYYARFQTHTYRCYREMHIISRLDVDFDYK